MASKDKNAQGLNLRSSGTKTSSVSDFWRLTRKRDALIVLLTLVTGAIDAIGLIKLGGVFTSVMTGNMVFLGISVARKNPIIAYHTFISLGGYVVGTLIGAKVAGHAEAEEELWPRPIVMALVVELGLISVSALWLELVSGKPSTGQTFFLLALNACALGVQGSAVLRFGINGLSTTYLTGTLTLLLANFTKRKAASQMRSALILLALIFGAAIGAILALHLPRLATLFPLVVLAVVIVTAEFIFHRKIQR